MKKYGRQTTYDNTQHALYTHKHTRYVILLFNGNSSYAKVPQRSVHTYIACHVLLQICRTMSGAYTLHWMGTGNAFPGWKRPGAWRWTQPLPSAEVKNKCIHTFDPLIFLHFAHKDSLTFTLYFFFVINKISICQNTIKCYLFNRNDVFLPRSDDLQVKNWCLKHI